MATKEGRQSPRLVEYRRRPEMSERLHMLRTWTAGEPLRNGGPSRAVSLRQLTAGDADDLGRLLWTAFGHEGPDGFASAADALTEARDTLAGKWGPIIWEASLLGITERLPVAASVILRDDAYELQPLLAFLVTDPAHQRQGLGQQLLEQALKRLDAVCVHELHLAVTPGNRACGLYQRLGFQEIPR